MSERQKSRSNGGVSIIKLKACRKNEKFLFRNRKPLFGMKDERPQFGPDKDVMDAAQFSASRFMEGFPDSLMGE